MKKFLFLLCSAISLFGFKSQAQSFSIQKDTAWVTYSGSGLMSVYDTISVPAGSPGATLEWKVIACNFPASWLATGSFGICDNMSCYPFSSLWTSSTLKTSNPYQTTGVHDFHMQFNLSGVTTYGTYYATVKLKNTATSHDTNMVFAVSIFPTAVPQVKSTITEVSVYPNPAVNEVNVVFDANADVKSISVYNNIGRVMSVYKVMGNSANLSLDNMPSGIYFVRLTNSQGELVGTRKFTKQ
ncbi:MAG: T9SS type A sorting domain-containing protein [Taibaiella sp.]|nr:T9SS type A sorting domain-containing protein [Taibaiella sp.]